MSTAFSSGTGREHARDSGNRPVDLELSIGRSRPIRWLIAGGLLLVAAIAIGTAYAIGDFREGALANSQRDLENNVLLLERHFNAQLQQLELVQKDMVEQLQSAGIASREDLEREMSGRNIHLALKAKIVALPYVRSLVLVDQDGRLINSARFWPMMEINVADRAYFNALKSDRQLTTVLSEPVLNRVDGAWTMVLGRRLNGPDGQFLGIVTGIIELAEFENFFQSVALGENSTIFMFHHDGVLLARYPHIEEMIGRNFGKGPLVERNLEYLNFRNLSPLDGRERIGSVRKLGNYPIDIGATTTVSAALANWWGQMRFLIGAACLATLVIALVLFLIVRQVAFEHRHSRQRLALEKQRLDIALDNMTQGLLLYDASERIVFCNQRYLDLFKLSPDVVGPGCSFRDLIAHRKALGSFVGDVDEFCSLILDKVAQGNVSDVIQETPDGRSMRIVNRPLATGGWVATIEDVTERKRSDERIVHLAHYDALTDLPNRALFREQLDAALKTVHRGAQLAVLYIDIDEFKSVNDTLGHPVGDELLKAVAARLRDCIRTSDFVARLGGDEFAIIQTAVERPTDTTDLVARIYQTIRKPYECVGHLLTTDASIGIALAPDDGTDLDQLLKNADLAMYGAKAEGRRTYRFFAPGMDARVKALRILEQDLRQAITEGGFELHYQPLVDLADNKVSGCEALLRWRHPSRGMISPAEFIPVAEDTGLINPLGEWVLTAACVEAARWPDDIKVAVNVSPVQFRSDGYALKVAAALAVSGLSAHRLELEITEAVLIRDDEAALAMLHQLRQIGVRIALDDFGTGYSSLGYLQRFPFDKIKIDRCFIKDVAETNGAACIVQAVVNIAAAQHMTTTAEGVETAAQLDTLRRLGCTQMQGYLFSPAIPAAEIMQLLRAQREAVAAA